MKVSIIIPVYNVEPYLDASLSSVLVQTMADFEVIAVDDGSSDASPAILQSYAAADHRLHVFTQANRGVSAARNRALREAQGDYILCVDSDDLLRPDALEQLCRCASKTDADIVLGRAQVRGADGAFYEMFPRPAALDGVQCLRGDLLYAALMPTLAFPSVVYQYLCKRKFLLENSLFFKEGIVHEDELWCAQVMCLAARAALTDACHYDYLPRAGSIMQSDNLAYRVESMFVVAQALREFVEAQRYYLSPAAHGWLMVRVFWLYRQMGRLAQRGHSLSADRYQAYFRGLLVKVFERLDGEIQEECLKYYRQGMFLLTNCSIGQL